MTDQQLYLSIGIPRLAVLIAVLVNIGYFIAINNRLGALEIRLDARITGLETKFDTKFDILVGKVIEMGNRIVRLEERLKH